MHSREVVLRSKCERSAWVRDFPDMSRSYSDVRAFLKCATGCVYWTSVRLDADECSLSGVARTDTNLRSVVPVSEVLEYEHPDRRG